jgi:hypothetical protein
VMLSPVKNRPGGGRRTARRSMASGLAVALGASALVVWTAASPAMATASDCHDHGSGYAAGWAKNSNGTYTLNWYQVWTKHSRQYCTDFYLTSQGSHATYAGFYKSPSVGNDWTMGDAGEITLNAGSDGNAGKDMVTNLLVGTQLNIGTSNGGGQSVTVAF